MDSNGSKYGAWERIDGASGRPEGSTPVVAFSLFDGGRGAESTVVSVLLVMVVVFEKVQEFLRPALLVSFEDKR